MDDANFQFPYHFDEMQGHQWFKTFKSIDASLIPGKGSSCK